MPVERRQKGPSEATQISGAMAQGEGSVAPESTCTAATHGTADAYQHHGCRCPVARRALRRQIKRRQLAHLRGLPPIIDATGTRRRLQALAVQGHSLAELGHNLNRTANTVHEWQTRSTVVTRTTARSVAALYDRISDTPGSGPRVTRVRNDALRHGWLPPIWWDDDTIDDPIVDNKEIVRRCREQDQDGGVDPIAVERYLAGDGTISLRREEKRAAFVRLIAAGSPTNTAGKRLGINGQYAARYAAEAGINVCDSRDDAHMNTNPAVA